MLFALSCCRTHGIFAPAAGKWTRPRVIYTAHGFHFYRGGSALRNQVFRSLEKLAGNWTDHLVVLNQEDHEAAVRYRLVPSGQVCLMPGIGVDTAIYSP